MSCRNCNCAFIGCYGRCDLVQLPIFSPTDLPIELTVHVGSVLTMRWTQTFIAGDPITLNLEAIGQIGRFQVQVLGQCFEFDVKTIPNVV